MRAMAILILAAALALSPEAQAGTHRIGVRAHAPGAHLSRAHKPRAPRKAYRSIRIQRADGSVLTGYRDSIGTHLTGPDGRTVHCRRGAGGHDIEIACR